MLLSALHWFLSPNLLWRYLFTQPGLWLTLVLGEVLWMGFVWLEKSSQTIAMEVLDGSVPVHGYTLEVTLIIFFSGLRSSLITLFAWVEKTIRIRDLPDACYEKCPFYLNYYHRIQITQYMIDTIVFATFKGKLLCKIKKNTFYKICSLTVYNL